MDYPEGNTVVRGLQTVPGDTSVDDVIDIVQKDGAVILEGVLSARQVAAINVEIDAAIAADLAQGLGGHESGRCSAHVANLVTLSKTFRDAFLDQDNINALVLALLGGSSGAMWLSCSEVLESRPGDEALPLGRSLYHYPIFLPYGPGAEEVTCSMYVALGDSTQASGAVRLIPGSHEWDFCEPYQPESTIPVPLKAGAVLFCSGKLVHGIGANVSQADRQRLAVALFNIASLVPLDAHPLQIPAEIVRDMSPRLRQMTGFQPFRHRGLRSGSLWRRSSAPGDTPNG
ncbi:phytanoyl-CoA dioxygenase family protein [Pseudomonas sp. NY15181]|uniref:phytanoyl-CoA dioxygenase family protein n=1 Tax=Pseudomonas TaxID=286 RepID=UPI0002C4ECF5|nr:phytanoyl-CoA dioxygenase family protein [Pseudomonas sp. ATCC 13867]AGI25815.1 hypothetical protein H681_19740 [Pseudomonas sp. ATCC 13867]RFQ24816.1 phytanoyl-CoA dioxygenase family protein [Pseudomonas sp. ATCC 13867]